MIKLKTVFLKKFLDGSKLLKENYMLPIYGYVKLECKKDGCVMYKSNGHSFFVYNMEEAEYKKDVTVLINEKTLSAAVSFSSSKEITITIKGDSVILDDDNVKRPSKTEPNEHFPAIQEKGKEKAIFLSQDVLLSIFNAKSHIAPPADKAMRQWTAFVHLLHMKERGWVVGLNGHISYFKSFNEVLPSISLEPEVVSIITRFSALNYSRIGNYDYFDTGNMAYGFIKSETVCPALETVIDKFNPSEHFLINKQDAILYCESVIEQNNTSVPPEVLIKEEGENISLNFQNIMGDEGAKQIMEVKKTFSFEEFILQPKYFITVLKAIEGESVKISFIQHNMVLQSESDANYVGSIMQLAKI